MKYRQSYLLVIIIFDLLCTCHYAVGQSDKIFMTSGHTRRFDYNMKLTPDEAHLMTYDSDYIRLWKTETGQMVNEFRLVETSEIKSISYSHKLKRLIYINKQGNLVLIDTRNSNRLSVQKIYDAQEILLPQGDSIAYIASSVGITSINILSSITSEINGFTPASAKKQYPQSTIYSDNSTYFFYFSNEECTYVTLPNLDWTVYKIGDLTSPISVISQDLANKRLVTYNAKNRKISCFDTSTGAELASKTLASTDNFRNIVVSRDHIVGIYNDSLLHWRLQDGSFLKTKKQSNVGEIESNFLLGNDKYYLKRFQLVSDTIFKWKYLVYDIYTSLPTDSALSNNNESEYYMPEEILLGKTCFVTVDMRYLGDGMPYRTPIIRTFPLRTNNNPPIGLSTTLSAIFFQSHVYQENNPRNIISRQLACGYGAYDFGDNIYVSPSRKYAFARDKLTIYPISLNPERKEQIIEFTNEIKLRRKNGQYNKNFHFSPDEKHIVVEYDSLLVLYETFTGNEVFCGNINQKSDPLVYDISNSHLIYTSGTDSLYIHNIYGDQEKPIIVDKTGRIRHLKLVRNNIVVTMNDEVLIFSLSGNLKSKFRPLIPVHGHSDNDRIFLMDREGNVQIVDRRSGNLLQYLTDTSEQRNADSILQYQMFAANDNRNLLTINQYRELRLWDLENAKIIWKIQLKLSVAQIVFNSKVGNILLLFRGVESDKEPLTISFGEGHDVFFEDKDRYHRADILDLRTGQVLFSTSHNLQSPQRSEQSTFSQNKMSSSVNSMAIGSNKAAKPMVTYNESAKVLCISYVSRFLLVYLERNMEQRWIIDSTIYQTSVNTDSNIAIANQRRGFKIFNLNNLIHNSVKLDSIGYIGEILLRKNSVTLIINSSVSKVLTYFLDTGSVTTMTAAYGERILCLSPNGEYCAIGKFLQGRIPGDSVSIVNLKSKKTIFKSRRADRLSFDKSSNFLVATVGYDSAQIYDFKSKRYSEYRVGLIASRFLGDNWVTNGADFIDMKSGKKMQTEFGTYFADDKNYIYGFTKTSYVKLNKLNGSVEQVDIGDTYLRRSIPIDSGQTYLTSSLNKIIKWSPDGNVANKVISVENLADSRMYQNSDSTFIVANERQGVLFRTKDLTSILTFFPSNTIGLNFLLPNLYYSIGKDELRRFNLNSAGEIYSLRQLDVKYNRPDKIWQVIGGANNPMVNAYYRAYEKRIKRLNIDTAAFKNQYGLPVVIFRERDSLKFEQYDGNLRLQIYAEDQSLILSKLSVWVNETPIYGIRGIDLINRRNRILDTTVIIPLSFGTNIVEASVVNSTGFESYRSQVQVQYTSRFPITQKTYFLGIGVGEFADARHNLSWSTRDIRRLALAFKDKYGAEIVIDTIFDKNVTISSVKALRRKLDSTSINDKVIIAYSGHGLLSANYDYYLSTYETNFQVPQNGSLPYDILESLLDSIPARHKLVLIDACHSGEVDKEELGRYKNLQPKLDSAGISMNGTTDVNLRRKGTQLLESDIIQVGGQNSFELMQELFINVANNTGAVVVSASSGTQLAIETDRLRNGLFTFSILECMRVNSHSKVSELRSYVNRRVSELSFGLQVPNARSETFLYDWNIW